MKFHPKSERNLLSLTLFFMLSTTSPTIAQVFVDASATGTNDGSSWTDAFTNLNQALNNTSSGEIWVAAGTYRPASCNPCTDADRQIAFLIPPDVQLYGGFDGSETALNERDFELNTTILSGDIGIPLDSLDNSYRVLIAENSTFSTVLDGFTIEEGNADGSFGLSSGGGLLLDANPMGTAHMQVRNCRFLNNYAGGGGAVAIDCVLGGQSQALFRNCHFSGNTASLGVVSSGAGIFILGNSAAEIRPQIISCTFDNNFVGNDGAAISATPTGAGTLLAMVVDSCVFRNNVATDRGGAIWYRMSSNGDCEVSIRNSEFTGNCAGGQGGAIFARSSFSNVANDTILNCLFSQNKADGTSTINDGEGGAVFLRASQDGIRNHQLINCVFDRNSSSDRGGAFGTTSFVSGPGTIDATLINCTFFRNKTDGLGGAIHTDGSQGMNTLSIQNSILRQDSTAIQGNEIANNSATVNLTYSNIDGGIPSDITDDGNNLSVEPEFADPENGDLHLLSCSPLINIGNNDFVPAVADPDPDGDPRIHQGVVDLGAYERGILFVDRDATGANTGRSWQDAFVDLQDAIRQAGAGDQIWVAEGVYVPIFCNPCSDQQRQVAFRLKTDVELYGGFNATETSVAERDWESNLTILSGDIGLLNDSLDNTYNVIIAENSSDKTILDGFIVEDGNADGSFGLSSGGGILIDANPGGVGDIQVRNCTIRNNYAGGGGGVAIDCVLGGQTEALFRNCRFEGNTASFQVVSSGAAVFIQGNSGALIQPRFVGCVFEDNFCGNDGGAFSATPTGSGSILAFELDSCQFLGNRAGDRGGAVWYRMSSEGQTNCVIKNSIFQNNIAGGQGGAIFARSSFDNLSNDTIINCRFIENTANGTSTINEGEGGAVFLRGSQNGVRNQVIVNCLFDRNHASARGGALGTTSSVAAAGTINTEIVNCTFVGNTTLGDGGALHLEASDGENSTALFNTILWGNTADGLVDEIFTNNAEATLTNCNISGGVPSEIIDGGSNLMLDPLFLDPAAGNYRLAGCSPMIEAGLNSAIPLDLIDIDADTVIDEQIEIDLDANPRIFNAAVDLGAYEWNGDPPALELVLNVPSDTGICLGETLLLSATASGGVGNLTFFWNNGLGEGSEQEVSPDTNTPYQVTVTDEFGCIAEDSVMVSVFALPEAMIVGDTAFCEGFSTTLDAGVFATYDWSTGQDSQIIEVEEAGIYSVTVIDANGCQGSDQVTVIENDSLTPTIQGSLSFCPGSGTTLEVDPFASSYLWSTADTTQTIEVTEVGEYSVIVTDAEGCQGIATVTISEIAVPEGEDDFFLLDLNQGLSLELNLIQNDFIPNLQDWVILNLTKPEIGDLGKLEEGITTYTADFDDEAILSFQYDLCSIQCPDYCDNTNVVLEVLPRPDTDEIILFPNPMTSSAVLDVGKLEGPIQLEIYDSLGKLLRREVQNVESGNLVIQRGEISGGGYILRLTQEKNTFELKFIIQ